MRKLHHVLPRGHDLSRFPEVVDHRAVGIGSKGGIGRFVLCDFRFGFCRGQLRLEPCPARPLPVRSAALTLLAV